MTYSKQIRELEALIEKLGKDFKIIEFIDNWKFKYDGPMGMTRIEEVRDVATLETVYEQFINKSGNFYESYKVTAIYRSFVYCITREYYKPRRRTIVYEDSYNKFHEEWNKLHPEISYEKYEKRENENDARRLSELMAIYEDPYFKIKNILS